MKKHEGMDSRLIVAVASSALFDLAEADRVFRERGEDEYRRYQKLNEGVVFDPGVAFSFVRQLLDLNAPEHGFNPVEVVLLSRNSPSTGVRIMNSLEHYALNITRAAFTEGAPPWTYIRSFGAHLFLTENEDDVVAALEHGIAAGRVGGGQQPDGEVEGGLRIAFDFDGILASDESEAIYQDEGLEGFERYERANLDRPLQRGPLAAFFSQVAHIQAAEKHLAAEVEYTPKIRTALVTARGPKAFMRAVMSLRDWGLEVNEAFFLSGMEKSRTLAAFAPHIFFDDSLTHVRRAQEFVPSVHVPYGVQNLRQK